MTTRSISTWSPVDMTAVLDDDLSPPQPVWLLRDDRQALIYREMLHLIVGESESGKSWVGLLACMQAIASGRPALYVDYESTPQVAASRLLALGCSKDSIVNGLVYVRPAEPLTDATVEDLAPHVREEPPSVAVVDGVNEGLAVQGLDMNSATDVGRFYRALPRRLARIGAAVLMLDHPVKNREDRGRWASGSQHKISGVDVAYTIEATKPFGVGLHGISRLRLAKDRPGSIRAATLNGWAADLHLRSEADGSVFAELHPPRTTADVFRPTHLMEAISRAIEAAGEAGFSGRAIRGAVNGRDEHKAYATE